MTFVTRRPLDTWDEEQDFLVPVGERLGMVYAFNTETSSLGSKHTYRGNWAMRLDPSGSVTGGTTIFEKAPRQE